MKIDAQTAHIERLAAAIMVLTLLLFNAAVWACTTDADCGAGGTCIKREKRAGGVCYGGARAAAPAAAAASDAMVDVPIKPVTGERRENAKAWLGDPDQMLKEHLPGKEVGGTCMVTQDCPSGFDCVIAGFEGHCVKL